MHSPAEPRSSWARLGSRAARTVLLTFLFTGSFTGLDVIPGLGPAEVRAQTSPESDPPLVSDEDKARAKVYFERAETLKHSGSARAQSGDMDGARTAYAEAAGVYMRAFELFPHPAFLYNAAQMYRLSGKSARAIAAYERYLEVDPEGDKAEDARAHIAELRREQAARPGTAVKVRGAEKQPAEDAKGTEDTENEDDAEEGDEDAEDEDTEDAGAEDGEEDGEDAEGIEDEVGAAGDGEVPAALGNSEFDDEDEPRDTGRPLRIGGLAAAAAGALAFGIGVKYGLDARGIADDLSGPRYMWDLEDRELFAEGERAERNAIILMGIGGAALVTGGVLYLVGHNRDGSEAEDSDLGVSASATSDGASMLLWGRF